MASHVLGLTPPNPLKLEGNLTVNFRIFKQSLELYLKASGLDGEDTPMARRAAILLHVIGEEALEIYNGFTWEAAADKDDVGKILDKFEAYCTPRTNTTFERHKFHQKVQGGDNFEKFYSELCVLIKTCDYGDLKDQMLRDRIVCGVARNDVKRRLLREYNLTLDKCLDICRAAEAMERQAKELVEKTHASSNETTVNQVQKKKFHKKKSLAGSLPTQSKHPNSKERHSGGELRKCNYCGYNLHPRNKCPARNSDCHSCGVKGHFSRVCRKKHVHCVDEDVSCIEEDADENEEFDPFLGTVQLDTLNIPGPSDWRVNITVNSQRLNFKIDTGADVCTIPANVYNDLFAHRPLHKAKQILRGPDRQALKILGYFPAYLGYKSKKILEDIYVLNSGSTLLSRKASESLGIVKLVGEVSADDYPELFSGLGCMQGTYTIKLESNAVPYSLSVPRRVPLPLMDKVKTELERLEDQGVIRQVQEPTDWCAPMVVVPKSGGVKVRICVDLTKLNNAVCRERHILPSVDETLGKLAGAKIFSKLDANSGFYQVPLDKESALLTTFITPFGRYCYQRLPFGISSGPELFQARVSKILEGQEGVTCMIDDILVHGSTQEEHDSRLKSTLSSLSKAGVTLNAEKCEFSKTEVHFLGHVVNAEGISVSPNKVKAILDMPEPSNVSELRTYMGMVNQLGKFLPNLAEITEPLRALLNKESEWFWGPSQQQACQQINVNLTRAPVLALYDPSRETKVTSDASQHGLGGVLSQLTPDGWRPVAFASRSLTETESRYATIEKEALGTTWACERFHIYLIGKDFTLETDHKPLVPLLGSKDLDLLPARIQRFRLRLMRFRYKVVHVPGKDLRIADALSRAPSTPPDKRDRELEHESTAFISAIMQNLPATDRRLEEIRAHQAEDDVCRSLKKYCLDGWPEKHHLQGLMTQYWSYRGDITLYDGLLVYGTRIVIPSSMRQDILDKLHEGHQGITKTRERAKESVWWPGISTQIAELVQRCHTCTKLRIQGPEPLIPSELPQYAWQKVGSDLFQYQGYWYLLVVDYYSRYIEVAKLNNQTSQEIIRHMKSIFARHGIPEILVSDNGTQYSSSEFALFSNDYGFSHVTCSPNHQSGNGAAERAVQTIKSLLKASNDPYAAMLAYRSTPLSSGFSPAELLMGRKLRTKVPKVQNAPTPNMSQMMKNKDDAYRFKQKLQFDQRHRVKQLPTLAPGQNVWLPDREQSGQVEKQLSPKAYLVNTPSGQYRRNRKDINSFHDPPETELSSSGNETPIPVDLPNSNPSCTTQSESPTVASPAKVGDGYTTRFGRAVKTPSRFKD